MEENMASGEMIEESMAERKSLDVRVMSGLEHVFQMLPKTTHYTRKNYAMTQHRQTRHRNTE